MIVIVFYRFNLQITLIRISKDLYAKRATIEKNIWELLYEYPLVKIPT